MINTASQFLSVGANTGIWAFATDAELTIIEAATHVRKRQKAHAVVHKKTVHPVPQIDLGDSPLPTRHPNFSITTPGVATPPSVLHPCFSDRIFEIKLRATISANLTTLKKATHALTVETESNPDTILRYSVCKIACLVLRHILMESGIPADIMTTRSLSHDHVSSGHVLVRVVNPDTGTEFIIDPTWQQFLHILTPEEWPNSQILLIKALNVENLVKSINALRMSLRLKGTRQNYFVYKMSDKSFMRFFGQIWNLVNYTINGDPPLRRVLTEYLAHRARYPLAERNIKLDLLVETLGFEI